MDKWEWSYRLLPFSLQSAAHPGNQRGKHNKLKDVMIVVAATNPGELTQHAEHALPYDASRNKREFLSKRKTALVVLLKRFRHDFK